LHCSGGVQEKQNIVDGFYVFLLHFNPLASLTSP
jgi:hypothetical protein